MPKQPVAVKTYFFPLILISSIFLGGLTGYFSGQHTLYLKPLGEIFLNLIYTAIVPLIFFSVASAIAKQDSLNTLGKIIFYMALVFLFTGTIAAIYTIFIVTYFPPAQGVAMQLPMHATLAPFHFSDRLAGILTVPNFSALLSHENILALIVFSMLVGIAASISGAKATLFVRFLQAGEDIFMRVFTLIMYYAPIGFFAYFAVLVSELGPQLMTSYVRVAIIYYVFSIIYFICAFSCYAYLAGRMVGIKLFWQNIFLPMITAIATCSSAASIPANLMAVKNIRVSSEIYETVVPLGTIIHKEGSIMGGVIKIAFLFALFHLNFSGTSVLLTAVGVSLLVGTVMGAIPSGGMLGELLILNIYGFPPSALIAIAAISIIIDPPATMLNVTGNTISSMLVARLVHGKKWMKRGET